MAWAYSCARWSGWTMRPPCSAFSEFINGATATPNQIEFINLVVQELTQTGVMEPGRLFESPFTDVNA